MPETDEEQKWRDLVGGFILAFGEIEVFTYRLWREHLTELPPPRNFKSRTEKLISALEKEDKYAPIIGQLSEALRLADKRNTVAHNPMAVQVFEHTKTGHIFIDHAITSQTNDNYIDDLELKELLAQAEDIVTELFKLVGYVAAETKHAS